MDSYIFPYGSTYTIEKFNGPNVNVKLSFGGDIIVSCTLQDLCNVPIPTALYASTKMILDFMNHRKLDLTISMTSKPNDDISEYNILGIQFWRVGGMFVKGPYPIKSML